jgi:cytochrome d ubiquinol oxidase subunit I
MVALTSLDAARIQMAVSLGFHIVFAALGIGLPPLLLFTEYRAIRTADLGWMTLTRRWAKALGVLVAVGAVSGTVLSFALGLFWPGLMGRWGSVIGLPFALEAFAFFIEAIFVGIYLYGWDRLSPWAHWLSGWPVALGGVASAWFVVTANAWMQTPVGFRLAANGTVVDVQPINAMLNPATPVMTAHMIIAGYMATGFAVASVYAVGTLRGRRDVLHHRGLATGLVVGVVLAPLQVFVGDRAARLVASRQPVKLAAMEGLWRTQAGAPLTIGGIPLAGRQETVLGIHIPKALSWLATGDPNAVIRGLSAVPPGDRPNTLVVHLAFQAMVVVGFAMAGLGTWALVGWLRRSRHGLPDGRWFLRAAAVAGPATFLALESGWVVTEVGRQPWIVQGYLRTSEAVTTRGGIAWWLAATVLTYVSLGAACAWLLHRLAVTNRGGPTDPAMLGASE